MSVRYENTGFPGFDIRYVKLDNPDSCETLCTADPHCQFYTYVFTSFYEPDYRSVSVIELRVSYTDIILLNHSTLTET